MEISNFTKAEQYLSIKNSDIIFYLSLILIPFGMFSKMWISGLQSAFMGKEYYIILLIGTFIILLSFDLEEFLSLSLKFPNIESKFLLLLSILILISTIIFNPVEFSKISYIVVWLSYIVLFLVYFFILPRLILNNTNYLIKFFKIISNFGFLFSLLGILMYIGNIHPIPDYAFGMISLINHPNNTSIVITITLFPTIYLTIINWNKFTTFIKSFYIFSILLQLTGQMLTYTRAGMIATSIGLIFFFIMYFKGKSLLIMPILFIIVPVFGVAFFQAKGFASFISRFYLLLPAYTLIIRSRESLLWGYGLNNSIIEYKKTLVQFLPNEYLINDPHNTYVTLMLMFGVIFTLMLMIMVFVIIIKCFYRAIKFKNYELKLFYLLIVSSTLSILTQGLFDTELIKADFYTIHYLLVMFGLAYYSFKIISKNEKFRLI